LWTFETEMAGPLPLTGFTVQTRIWGFMISAFLYGITAGHFLQAHYLKQKQRNLDEYWRREFARMKLEHSKEQL